MKNSRGKAGRKVGKVRKVSLVVRLDRAFYEKMLGELQSTKDSLARAEYKLGEMTKLSTARQREGESLKAQIGSIRTTCKLLMESREEWVERCKKWKARRDEMELERNRAQGDRDRLVKVVKAAAEAL